MKIANLEREMTKKEKAKEKRLKDKYDDSDMKKSMKKQYGKDWKNVYYATIRKKAMEQDTNEGYYKMPNIDKERYTPMPGLEGPFQTMSGKPVYYDPKEGSYYDRDTDMYLTYAEFKALDDPKPTIGKDVNEVDKSAIDAAVQQALDSDIPVPKTRPTKVPRPKPRPVMIGSNPKTGATRGIDPALNYSPEDLKRLLMQSAMERMETEGKSLASLRNRSSFDAQARLKDKNKLPAPKVVKPAQLDLFNDSVQNEGEAGDHDRMYKVVHVKKGMMDIKAKTSYEAAKKFAQEKGLKSTAGVDVHLYPLEESKSEGDAWYIEQDARRMAEKDGHDWSSLPYGRKSIYRNKAAEMRKDDDEDDMYESAMSDLHARIMSSDDPHGEIYKMLTQSGPEAKYIQDMYNETSIDRGLHPDDDFEDIIDAMVAELDDDTPFENMHPMVAPPNKNPKFKSNMPMAQPNKNSRINTDFYKRMQKSFQQQGQEKPWWMREGENKMGPQEIMPGDRVEHEGEKFEVVDVTPDPDAPGTIIADNLETGLRNRLKIDDVTRLFGMDAMTDQDKDNLDAMFKRLKKAGSGSLKHTATEGHSPHKKGTKKYKAHMAAMHANSVDLNAMRDALKLDESTDANTVVAQYTRATLDQRHDTWGKVCEQIDHVRSFVKEDIDIRTVKNQILKMHEQEKIDNKILIVENIDILKEIVKENKTKAIKFADGSVKVDATTASVFLEVYNKQKQQKQEKIVEKIQTKAGFISMLEMMYKKIG